MHKTISPYGNDITVVNSYLYYIIYDFSRYISPLGSLLCIVCTLVCCCVLSLQDSRVLHCYNAHNDYVITLKAYNEVCSSVVETHHPYLLDVSCCHGDGSCDHTVLQDMQGIHNDLTRRMASAMKQYITLVSEKVRNL